LQARGVELSLQDQPVLVTALAFVQKDSDPPVSSLREGGAIKFTDLKRDPITIASGDRIHIGGPAGLQISRIDATDLLKVKVEGVVNRLETEKGNRPQSLLPSRLDWVQEHNRIHLLIGTFVALVGLALAVLTRWRVSALKEHAE
jgi:hypothetical protein